MIPAVSNSSFRAHLSFHVLLPSSCNDFDLSLYPLHRPFQRPSQFAVPRPPKFDKGPRCRAPATSLSVTPFPRHVDMKMKLDPGFNVPFERCASASSGSIDSRHQADIKPDTIKTERG